MCERERSSPRSSPVRRRGVSQDEGVALSRCADCDKSGSPEPDAGGGQLSKLGTSPRINKFLAREPPDGCEKVKIIDEGRSVRRLSPRSVAEL